MNKASVIVLEKRFKGNKEKIKKIVLKILKIFKKDKVSVEIYLTDHKKMRIFNKKFRYKDKTTTILSFKQPRNFILPPSEFKHLGEIYLNVADKFDKVYKVYLLIHGLLHLFGFNHIKKNDRIKMEDMEQKALHKILNAKL